jgi:hypothetical protein
MAALQRVKIRAARSALGVENALHADSPPRLLSHVSDRDLDGRVRRPAGGVSCARPERASVTRGKARQLRTWLNLW